MKSEQIVLASRPIGFPSEKNLRIEEQPISNIEEGEVLLKAWYISVDPYMRGRMNDARSYAKPYQVNEPIKGGVIARVVESNSNVLKKGDLVSGTLPWATYCKVKADSVIKIDPGIAPPSYYLGIMGMPGLTAYFGITAIGKPTEGETVIVSGAAGAVGLVAGQIANIFGSKVVGIAGSDEKCQILKEEFGFAEVLNYKTAANIRRTIANLCPEGVDVYFDNVGGKISEGVIDNLNFYSRVIVCGQISQYNNTRIQLVPDILPKLLTRSILVKGFIVNDYNNYFPEASVQISKWIQEGKLKYKETIIHGFKKLPETFMGLFNGMNTGKMLVEVE